jgi:hypothetical protein
MTQVPTTALSEQNPSLSNENDLGAAVAIANQYANTILLALRTIHEYVAPRALAHGIKLSARELHAWSVSLSIALSQSKAHYRMPATRLEKPVQKKAPATSVPSPKTKLFPRSEQLADSNVPFSSPTIAPALHKLRQFLQRDAITEAELLRIVHESSPRQTLFLDNLDQIPTRTAELCLERWPTIVELVEASRNNGPEAA